MEHESSGISDSGSKMDTLKGESGVKAEIDTSAPFESVKEAVTRFGGIGYWKPSHIKLFEPEHDMEDIDIAKVEEQSAQLEKDLIVKERETLDILKELESTKLIVEGLKSKLQKEASEVKVALETNKADRIVTSMVDEADKEIHENFNSGHPDMMGGYSCPASTPGLILMELKQAKLNLSRTTTDLADIRTSVESLNRKLDKERISLAKTREKLTLNSSKLSSVVEELNHTRQKLQLVKDAEIRGDPDDHLDISRELQRLNSEAEQFKKMGEAARSEVLRVMSEIEQTKARIKTAEIRFVAARKMKEAARAAEAVALVEIKALSNIENSSGVLLQNSEAVTLSHEEYSSLICKARDAEERSKRRVIDAMLQVDEANVSKMEILKKVEEATAEVKSSKKVLEEALNRVEAANRGKLAVEEALRNWRSEHGQRRRSVQNSTKFKNSYPLQHRREPRLFDVNGLNLVGDGSAPVLKPTLSIGQILSRKLLLPEEIETRRLAEKGTVKRKVSLGQMLSSKQYGNTPSSQKIERESSNKQFSGKRKKFGFARFSLHLTKQSKKKKKPTLNLR